MIKVYRNLGTFVKRFFSHCTMTSAPDLAPDLQLLFDFVSPRQLRNHLHYFLIQYFIYQPAPQRPEHLGKIVEDLYYLLDFLEKAEDLEAGETKN